MSSDHNKMASWIKVIVMGAGVAGAIFGLVRYFINHEETPHERLSVSRTNPRRSNGTGSLRNTSQKKECKVCSETQDELVTFLPCMHCDVCSDCASMMKKCLTCCRPIVERIAQDGKTVPYKDKPYYSDSACTICYEGKKTIIFNCNHTCCEGCSTKLEICPMCRKTITTKNTFY